MDDRPGKAADGGKLRELWTRLRRDLERPGVTEKLELSEYELRELLEALEELVQQNWRPKRRCVLYVDGASRGNPGPSGIGIVIRDSDSGESQSHSEFIGEQTNNVAEYTALVRGLEKVKELGYESVEVRSDSELMVKQLRGEFRTRNANLLPLWQRARSLLGQFNDVKLVQIPREENREADFLSSQAIDLAVATGSGTDTDS